VSYGRTWWKAVRPLPNWNVVKRTFYLAYSWPEADWPLSSSRAGEVDADATQLQQYPVHGSMKDTIWRQGSRDLVPCVLSRTLFNIQSEVGK